MPGLAGLLVSPSRGLLVFSPFLAFALVGAAHALFRPREQRLMICLLAGTGVVLLAHGRWSMWFGGHSFGYRIVIDVLPALMLLVGHAWRVWLGRSRPWRAAFLLLVAVSLPIHVLGAYVYPSGFNATIDWDARRLWDVRDGELEMCARRALRLAGLRVGATSWAAEWSAVPWTPCAGRAWISAFQLPAQLAAPRWRETVHGALLVSGEVRSAEEVSVHVLVNDTELAVVAAEQASRDGWRHFQASLPFGTFEHGPHQVEVDLCGPSGTRRIGPVPFAWTR